LGKAGIKDKMEIYLDGGIRRGNDIFKALALGAKAVGNQTFFECLKVLEGPCCMD